MSRIGYNENSRSFAVDPDFIEELGDPIEYASMLDSDTSARVDEALRRLSARQREALLLWADRVPIVRIAEYMGIRPHAVIKLLRLARRRARGDTKTVATERPTCGKLSGYDAHRQHYEEACSSCREVEARYRRERRASRHIDSRTLARNNANAHQDEAQAQDRGGR